MDCSMFSFGEAVLKYYCSQRWCVNLALDDDYNLYSIALESSKSWILSICFRILGQIVRGKIVRENFDIPEEFEVSFDLYLNSKRTDSAEGHFRIFRLTNTTNDNGNHGDRIIRLVAVNRENNDNRFRFLFSVGDDPNYVFKTDTGLPILEWIHVKVKQVNVSGTYKLQVFINDSMLHEVDNPSPNVYRNVTAYANEPYSRPADGTLINLRILPGEHCNFSK